MSFDPDAYLAGDDAVTEPEEKRSIFKSMRTPALSLLGPAGVLAGSIMDFKDKRAAKANEDEPAVFDPDAYLAGDETVAKVGRRKAITDFANQRLKARDRMIGQLDYIEKRKVDGIDGFKIGDIRKSLMSNDFLATDDAVLGNVSGIIEDAYDKAQKGRGLGEVSVDALKRGYRSTGTMLYTGAKMYKPGQLSAEDKELAKAAVQAGEEADIQTPRKAGSIKDVKGAGDFLTYAAESILENAPRTGGTAAAGLAGGLIGGPAGAAAGVFAAGLPLNTGEAVGDIVSEGRNLDRGFAIAQGAGYSALDAAFGGEVSMARVLSSSLRQTAAQSAKKSFVHSVKTAGREILKEGLGEAVTEPAQSQIIGRGVRLAQTGSALRTLPDGSKETGKDIFFETADESIGGFLSALGLGAGSTGYSAARNARLVAKADRDINALALDVDVQNMHPYDRLMMGRYVATATAAADSRDALSAGQGTERDVRNLAAFEAGLQDILGAVDKGTADKIRAFETMFADTTIDAVPKDFEAERPFVTRRPETVMREGGETVQRVRDEESSGITIEGNEGAWSVFNEEGMKMPRGSVDTFTTVADAVSFAKELARYNEWRAKKNATKAQYMRQLAETFHPGANIVLIDSPQQVDNESARRRMVGGEQAFYSKADDTVYIMLDALSNPIQAAVVMAHESGHKGLADLVADEAFQDSAVVLRLREIYNKRRMLKAKRADAVKKQGADSDIVREMDIETAALADEAEALDERVASSRERIAGRGDVIERGADAVGNWARRTFGMRGGATEADVRALARLLSERRADDESGGVEYRSGAEAAGARAARAKDEAARLPGARSELLRVLDEARKQAGYDEQRLAIEEDRAARGGKTASAAPQARQEQKAQQPVTEARDMDAIAEQNREADPQAWTEAVRAARGDVELADRLFKKWREEDTETPQEAPTPEPLQEQEREAEKPVAPAAEGKKPTSPLVEQLKKRSFQSFFDAHEGQYELLQYWYQNGKSLFSRPKGGSGGEYDAFRVLSKSLQNTIVGKKPVGTAIDEAVQELAGTAIFPNVEKNDPQAAGMLVDEFVRQYEAYKKWKEGGAQTTEDMEAERYEYLRKQEEEDALTKPRTVDADDMDEGDLVKRDGEWYSVKKLAGDATILQDGYRYEVNGDVKTQAYIRRGAAGYELALEEYKAQEAKIKEERKRQWEEQESELGIETELDEDAYRAAYPEEFEPEKPALTFERQTPEEVKAERERLEKKQEEQAKRDELARRAAAPIRGTAGDLTADMFGEQEGETPLFNERRDTPAKPSAEAMQKEAQRWQGAHMNAEKMLLDAGDRRGAMAVATASGKSNLDDYLMKKFGVDRATAHEVSNTLTQFNIPADRTAKVEDFAGEEWADAAIKSQATVKDSLTTEPSSSPTAPTTPPYRDGVDTQAAQAPGEAPSGKRKRLGKIKFDGKVWDVYSTEDQKAPYQLVRGNVTARLLRGSYTNGKLFYEGFGSAQGSFTAYDNEGVLKIKDGRLDLNNRMPAIVSMASRLDAALSRIVSDRKSNPSEDIFQDMATAREMAREARRYEKNGYSTEQLEGQIEYYRKQLRTEDAKNAASTIFGEQQAPAAPKDTATGTRAVAQRIVNAENAFIDFAMRTAGLTKPEAETALASYKKNKAIKIDPVGGSYSFTHGGFAEVDVLRRAAGREEAPAAVRNNEALDAYDYAKTNNLPSMADAWGVTRDDIVQYGELIPESEHPNSPAGVAWIAGYKNGINGVAFSPDVMGGGLASSAARGHKAGKNMAPSRKVVTGETGAVSTPATAGRVGSSPTGASPAVKSPVANLTPEERTAIVNAISQTTPNRYPTDQNKTIVEDGTFAIGEATYWFKHRKMAGSFNKGGFSGADQGIDEYMVYRGDKVGVGEAYEPIARIPAHEVQIAKPAPAAAPARFKYGVMATTLFGKDGVAYTGRIVSEDTQAGTVTIRATKERRKGRNVIPRNYGIDKEGKQITKDVTLPYDQVRVTEQIVEDVSKMSDTEKRKLSLLRRREEADAEREIREGEQGATDVVDRFNTVKEREERERTDNEGDETRFRIAYHGTPHLFGPEQGFPHGRFRLDKIGTGEGAQAYGWGVYFADSEGVADKYKDTGNVFYLDGKPMKSDMNAEYRALPIRKRYAIERLIQYGGEENALAEIDDEMKRFKNDPESLSVLREERDWVEKLADRVSLGANVYRLDIPDDVFPKMLDWDKPLSGDVARAINVQAEKDGLGKLFTGNIDKGSDTGQDAYEMLSSLLGSDQSASEFLARAGIPGLQYLDQQSRDNGEGTHNYVVWDQPTLDRVALLERNGAALDAIKKAQDNVDTRFRRASDAEYLAAVEHGDMEAAQRMVDEAAKAAGYTIKAYHNTDAEKITTFWPFARDLLNKEKSLSDVQQFLEEHRKRVANNERIGYMLFRAGTFFTPHINQYEGYGKFKYSTYLKVKNPVTLTNDGKPATGIDPNKSIDALIIKNNGTIDEIAVIDPTQIKSADPITRDDQGRVIPLSERFNESNDDIRFRLAYNRLPVVNQTIGGINDDTRMTPVQRQEAQQRRLEWAPGSIVSRFNSLHDKLRTGIQDSLLPAQRLYESVMRKNGVKKLPDDMDFVQKARVHSSMLAQAAKRIDAEYIDPMLQALSKGGLTLDELRRYSEAKHAPFFNAMIAARRNGEMPLEAMVDALTEAGMIGDEIDPQAVARIFDSIDSGWAGKGLSDENAARIVAELEAKANGEHLKLAHERLMAMNRSALNRRVESGLMGKAEADMLQQLSPFYVPLHVEKADDDAGLAHTGSGGRNIGTREFKRALGHFGEENVDVIAQSLSQAYQAEDRALENEARKALLKFAEAYPDVTRYEVIDKVPLERVAVKDEKTGQIKAVMVPKRDFGMRQDDPVIIAKVDGQKRYIKFIGPTGRSVAHAVKGDLMIRNQMLTFLNRYPLAIFKMVNTAFSPEFMLTNPQADFVDAMANLSADNLGRVRNGVVRNLPSAWRALAAYDRGRGHAIDTEAGRYLKEAADNGMMFDAKFYGDTDRIYEDLSKKLEKTGGTRGGGVASWIALKEDADGKGLPWLLAQMDRANGIAEMGTRLSIYISARKNGIGVPQAVELARNVTVDFHRKGNWSPILNTLYAFSNVGIQATYRMGGAMIKSKKGRQVAVSIVALGFVNGLLNAWANGGGEGDDGEDEYKKLDEWYKEGGAPFRVGGKWYRARMRGIPAALWYTGQKMADVMTGYSDPMEASGRIARKFVSDVLNPLGSSGSIAQMLSPTLTDPVVQISENKRWTGRDLVPQGFDKYKPDSQKAYKTTPEVYKKVAEALNALGGGDAVTPGRMGTDVSPETFKLWTEFIGGGTLRFITRSYSAAVKASRGDEIDVSEVPFVRSFVYDADEESRQNGRYWEAKRKFDRAMAQYKGYDNAADKRRVIERYGYADPRTAEALKTLDKRINRLRENEDRIKDPARKDALRKRRLALQNRYTARID